VFRKIQDMQGGPGVLRAEFDLVTSEGQAIAAETQAYTFRGDEHSRIIDCQFTVRANNGPMKMGDSKEGMFAIPVAKALDSPPGRMVNSEGAFGEKAAWGKRADWVDCYENVSGEDVAIAILPWDCGGLAARWWLRTSQRRFDEHELPRPSSRVSILHRGLEAFAVAIPKQKKLARRDRNKRRSTCGPKG
jgi:hypothetical protein